MAWIYILDDVVQGIYASEELALADTISLGTIEEATDSELESKQKSWRNKELKDTDWVVPVTDHPKRASYLAYRTKLRDWPSTDDFPNTKPTL